MALQKKTAEMQKMRDGDARKIKEIKAKDEDKDEVIKKSLLKDKWMKDLQEKLKEANKTIELLKKGQTHVNTLDDDDRHDDEVMDYSPVDDIGYQMLSPLKPSPVKERKEIASPKRRFQISFRVEKRKQKVRKVPFKKLKKVLNNI